MTHADGTRESGFVPPDKGDPVRQSAMTAIDVEQREFRRRFPNRQPYDYYNNFYHHLSDDSQSSQLAQRGIIRALDLWDTEFRNHPDALKEWSVKKKEVTPAEFYKEVDEVVEEIRKDSSIPPTDRLQANDLDLASLIKRHSGPGSTSEKLEEFYRKKLSEIFIRLRMRGYNYDDLTR